MQVDNEGRVVADGAEKGQMVADGAEDAHKRSPLSPIEISPVVLDRLAVGSKFGLVVLHGTEVLFHHL